MPKNFLFFFYSWQQLVDLGQSRNNILRAFSTGHRLQTVFSWPEVIVTTCPPTSCCLLQLHSFVCLRLQALFRKYEQDFTRWYFCFCIDVYITFTEDICYVEQVSLNNNTSSFNASCYSGPEDINVNVELLLDRTLENSKLRGKWKQAEVQSSNDVFTFRSK